MARVKLNFAVKAHFVDGQRDIGDPDLDKIREKVLRVLQKCAVPIGIELDDITFARLKTGYIPRQFLNIWPKIAHYPATIYISSKIISPVAPK